MPAAQSSMLYAINNDQELLWYQHTGADDGTDQWYTTPVPSGHVGTGWNVKHVFADGHGAIYTIDGDGFLRWYRHTGYLEGTEGWTYSNAPNGYIGEGWDMKHVFAGGNGVIYAINQQNRLLWYRHLGFQDGSDRWVTTPDPKGYIGEGWDMKHVFAGDNGVIYGVTQQNRLLWYRHLGFANGTDLWQTTPDPKGYIGEGWDMKHVFAGGNGVIYAVTQQDRLLWYRHLGFEDGTDRWETTPDPKGYIGEGWGFAHVFGGGFAPRNVGLRMQYQETQQWCWIAVGTSVAHYYNASSTSTQCGMMTSIGQKINGFPSNSSACPTRATLAATPGLAEILANPLLPAALSVLDSPTLLIPAQYVKPGGVGDALNVYGNWANTSYLASITLQQIADQIAVGRPVVFDILLAGGITHYVAVAGVLRDRLLVCDPGAGHSIIRYADFPTAYRGGATLQAVALTQPGPVVGAGQVGYMPVPVELT